MPDLLLLSGWVVAALALGLYLGERGRRRDLAWLVGHERREPTPAAVRHVPDAEAQAIELISREDKDRWIAELQERTGASYADAKKDVENQVSQLNRMGADGW
jgi:hypothetical protein